MKKSEFSFFFFFQAEDGIRDSSVTGVQTCALPISEDASGRKAVAKRDRRGIGSRIHDREAHVVDVGANRITEEHHLHDRQRDQHGGRSTVAPDVKELLSKQTLQRGHGVSPALPTPPALPAPAAPLASAGRASCTKSSSIDSTLNSPLSPAGVPIAAMRPATMIEMRSQYSASSM